MTRIDPADLRRARAASLQMLYQWEVGRVRPDEVIATYWPAQDPDGAIAEDLRTFANGLVRGTIERLPDIDRLLGAHAHNWRLERMAVIDRLVLRLATFELMTAPGTPARVIINEALELTRTYSGEEAVAFVNGVLDAVKRELRRE